MTAMAYADKKLSFFLMVLSVLGFNYTKSFAGSYSKEDFLPPLEVKSANSAYLADQNFYYFLYYQPAVVKVYGLDWSLKQSFKWNKKTGGEYGILADEKGNIAIYPTAPGQAAEVQLMNSKGEMLGVTTVPDIRRVSFQDGILYDKNDGSVFYKINKNIELNKDLYPNDFLVTQDKNWNPIKLTNKKKNITVTLPTFQGYVPSELEAVDFWGHVYFLYKKFVRYGDGLSDFNEILRTVIFDEDLKVIKVVDGPISSFNEKTGSFYAPEDFLQGKDNIVRWEYKQ